MKEEAKEGLLKTAISLMGNGLESGATVLFDTVFEDGKAWLGNAVYNVVGLGTFLFGDPNWERDMRQMVQKNVSHIYEVTWGSIRIPKKLRPTIEKGSRYVAIVTGIGPVIILRLISSDIALEATSLWCRVMSRALPIVFPGCEFGAPEPKERPRKKAEAA